MNKKVTKYLKRITKQKASTYAFNIECINEKIHITEIRSNAKSNNNNTSNNNNNNNILKKE